MLRIMGLDLGDKTIGVSISDETKLIAQGLCTIKRKSLEEDLTSLRKIIEDNNISEVVIGLPKNMDNTIGIRGNKSIEFAEIIRENFKAAEVILWDERLTTVFAERTLLEANVKRKNRKKVIDKIAAVLILQNYLDSLFNLKS
ncbi:MAG: Holliday junction resolvase RuvX [Firmicutes bacterium]|nr:Holliday junction resolvase RuvX [Bacillota bacterium]